MRSVLNPDNNYSAISTTYNTFKPLESFFEQINVLHLRLEFQNHDVDKKFTSHRQFEFFFLRKKLFELFEIENQTYH